MDTLAIREDLERVSCGLGEDETSTKSIDASNDIIGLKEISQQLASTIQTLQQELGLVVEESIDTVELINESTTTNTMSTSEKSSNLPQEEEQDIL